MYPWHFLQRWRKEVILRDRNKSTLRFIWTSPHIWRTGAELDDLQQLVTLVCLLIGSILRIFLFWFPRLCHVWLRVSHVVCWSYLKISTWIAANIFRVDRYCDMSTLCWLRNTALLGNRPVNKISAQTRWRHATVLQYSSYATCSDDVTRHRSRGISRDLRVSASDVTQPSPG
jgi:hypothetical protein